MVPPEEVLELDDVEAQFLIFLVATKSGKLGVLSSFRKPSLSLAENVLQELRYHECSMYF